MQNLENLDNFEILITQKLLKCPKDPFLRSALIYIFFHHLIFNYLSNNCYLLFIYLFIYSPCIFLRLFCFNVLYSHVVVHVFICIFTCLTMFISFYVCLDCRGRVLTNVVRTCDPIPLLYKNLAIKYV